MKKRFGQNLLIDPDYLKKSVNELNKSESKNYVLEIGAGSGNLTKHLSYIFENIYAVEFERDILNHLKENLKTPRFSNIKIINTDILALDIEKLFKGIDEFVVAGNIPYNITSKIIIKLLGEVDKPSSFIHKLKEVYLMVQYEVAQRITAKPNSKDYSPLTLLVNYFCESEILFKVPKTAFNPKPKVDSAFIKLKIKKEFPETKDHTLLKKIIRISFQQRRKKLVNSIAPVINDKELVLQIFKRLKLREDVRAENLSLDDFINLTNEYYASWSNLSPRS